MVTAEKVAQSPLERVRKSSSARGPVGKGLSMLHLLILLVVLVHGLGHTVGLWLPVPAWFALAWMLPGAGFLVGAWGLWQHAEWWPTAVVASAAGSLLLLALPPGTLRQAPFASALAFDVLVIAALVVPWTRRLVVGF